MTHVQQIEATEIKGGEFKSVTCKSDDPDALGEKVRKHVKASKDAVQNFVEHAMAAGDALRQARDQVPHGQWGGWLKRHCGLNERTAQRYMQLAEHRAELANPTRVSDLSLRTALNLIAKSHPPNRSEIATKSMGNSTKATSFEALDWWSNADHQARQDFLSGIGLRAILNAAPVAWGDALKREFCKSPAPVIDGEVVRAVGEEILNSNEMPALPDFLNRARQTQVDTGNGAVKEDNKPRTKMRKPSIETTTIENAVNDAWSEFAELAQEMRDAFENTPEPLQLSEVSQAREAAADALESLEKPDVPKELAEKGIEVERTPPTRRASRSSRCNDACELLSAVMQALDAMKENEEAAALNSELYNLRSEAECVDFPGFRS
jgi:hypothetical protein